MKPINHWKLYFFIFSRTGDLLKRSVEMLKQKVQAWCTNCWVSFSELTGIQFLSCLSSEALCQAKFSKTLPQYHIVAFKDVTFRSNASKPRQIKPVLAGLHTSRLMVILSDIADRALAVTIVGVNTAQHLGTTTGVKWVRWVSLGSQTRINLVGLVLCQFSSVIKLVKQAPIVVKEMQQAQKRGEKSRAAG